MPDHKLEKLKLLIEGAEISLSQARDLINEMTTPGAESKFAALKAKSVGEIKSSEEGIIIEGVFDGQNMVGPDGKQYSIPANYASKSKLVEGDVLKLTIDNQGSFIYKQIGPIERARKKGTLIRDEETDEFRVLSEGKAYKVLMASITYFQGEVGDSVVILAPKNNESSWAAVENIIKQGEEVPDQVTLGDPNAGLKIAVTASDETVKVETNQEQASAPAVPDKNELASRKEFLPEL